MDVGGGVRYASANWVLVWASVGVNAITKVSPLQDTVPGPMATSFSSDTLNLDISDVPSTALHGISVPSESRTMKGMLYVVPAVSGARSQSTEQCAADTSGTTVSTSGVATVLATAAPAYRTLSDAATAARRGTNETV